ncbi:hypothetical protein KDA_07110 [Dictyobacter alpinus]|uniref:Uncharacterized protein n=1 Tax=Dictyobacter alpinus TaxID=2014873 RepID=A0A402B1Q0_9CHLR|nr:hypothetical protein [Dictyobacter alpinus]GCE25227.1 hypothetical protein KDA_07110 [Dictyobacter alpinus]
MLWHTTAFCIEEMTIEEFIAHFPSSFLLTGQTFKARQAFSAGLPVPFAVSQIEAWTVLCDPLSIITWREQMLAEFSQGRRIFAFVIESAANTYGFWYFVDGQLLRHIMFQEGECVEEEGEILVEEKGIQDSWGYTEEGIFILLERITGFGRPQLNSSSFQGLKNELYASQAV